MKTLDGSRVISFKTRLTLKRKQTSNKMNRMRSMKAAAQKLCMSGIRLWLILSLRILLLSKFKQGNQR